MVPDFAKGFKSLLKLVTPKKGAAAILHRHPYRDIYFPIVVNVDRNLAIQCQVLENYYYLYATRITEEDLARKEYAISPDSSAFDLVLRGKLLLPLLGSTGARSVYKVMLHNADEGDDPPQTLLIIMGPEDAVAKARQDECDDIVDAAACFAREWANREPVVRASMKRELYPELCNLLHNTFPYPPTFPILHADVAIEGYTDHVPELCGSTAGMNPLGYNCYLLGKCRELTDAFIGEMFLTAATERKGYWHHQALDNAPPLVKAVADSCVSYVCKLGELPNDGIILCARHNVPHGQEENAKQEWKCAGYRQPTTYDSAWELVRDAIMFLQQTHKHTAATSVWLGQVQDGQVFVNALPVGIVPGQHVHLLHNAVTTSSELTGRRFSTSGGTAVKITAVFTDPDIVSPLHRRETERLLKEIAVKADEKLEATRELNDDKLPPPYVLEFGEQKYGDFYVDIKSQKYPRRRGETVQLIGTEGLFMFLVEVAAFKQWEVDGGFIANDRIDELLGGTGGRSASYKMGQFFRNRCLSEWNRLFRTQKKKVGGKLVSQRGLASDVVVKGLTCDFMKKILPSSEVKRIVGADTLRSNQPIVEAVVNGTGGGSQVPPRSGRSIGQAVKFRIQD